MKRFQSIGVLLSLITALLVLLLVSVFANSARQAYEHRQASTRLLFSARLVSDVSDALDELHREQGRARAALALPGKAGPDVIGAIADRHSASSKSVTSAIADLGIAAPDKPQIVTRITQARQIYERQYALVIASLKQPPAGRARGLKESWGNAVNGLADALQDPADRQLTEIAYVDPLTNQMARVIRMVQSLRGVGGISRRMVGEAISAGHPPSQALLRDLAEQDGRFHQPWTSLSNIAASADIPPAVKQAVTAAGNAYLVDTRRQRDRIMNGLASGRSPLTGREWMRISDRGLGALRDISDQALAMSQSHVEQDLAIANRQFYLAMLLMLISISLASLTAVFVHLRVIAPLRSIIETMAP